MAEICKYLFDEIYFLDNRIVPCISQYWFDNEKVEEYFISIDKYTTDIDIEEYIQLRNKYVQMAENGEMPEFCKNCSNFKSLNEEYKKQKEQNFSFSTVHINNKLKCSFDCTYCFSAKSRRTKKTRRSDIKKEYSMLQPIQEMFEKNYIDSNTIMAIFGGEYADNSQEISDIFELGKNNNCYIKIYTNGLEYREKIEEAVKQMIPLEVIISLDSGTKETFEKIKRVDKFDVVIENIKKYSKLFLYNSDFLLRLSYVICPGINDNIRESREFLEFAEKNDIKDIYLGLDSFWLEKNINKKVSSKLKNLLRFWFDKETFPSIKKNVSYQDNPKEWLQKAINQKSFADIIKNLYQKNQIEEKVFEFEDKLDDSNLDESLLYTEITDDKKVCKYLAQEISFIDNRVVPCGTQFWNNRKDVGKFFVRARKEMTEKDLDRYIEQKNKYIDMYLDGKEPIFCKNCKQYKPIDNEQNIEEIKNNKFSKIVLHNKLDCASRCTYCKLADGGKLENFEKNALRVTYDAAPLIKLIEAKGLIDSDIEIEIDGGEYTVYEEEFSEITDFVKRNKCNINIFTNGIKYSKKIEDLLKNNKINLLIPLDCGSKETYAKIKRTDNFEEVTENIKKYAIAAQNNEEALLRIKYTICPEINDNLEEFKLFLEFCEQNKIKQAVLTIDEYWYEKNKEKEMPQGVFEILKYWFTEGGYYEVSRDTDFLKLPKEWIEKQGIDISLQVKLEKDESMLFTEITDGRKVCKCLTEEISFIDNRLVPCGTKFWNNRKDVGKFFVKARNEMTAEDIERYIEQKNKYIDMYLDGKEPLFCNNCKEYKPIDENLEKEEIKNKKLSKITVVNKFKCSVNCTYCKLTDGGNLEKYAENEKRKTYDINPLLEAIKEKELIDENTKIEINRGEYTGYEEEFSKIAETVKQNQCSINLFTSGVNYSKETEDLLKDNRIILMIPLDSGTKETYAKIKRMDRFDEVTVNIKKYAQAAISNEKALLQLKYTICPEINDNLEEFKLFLEFCEQNKIKHAILGIDEYWLEKNKEKEIPQGVFEILKYWFTEGGYYEVSRDTDFIELPKEWIEKQGIDISLQAKLEKDESMLFTEITDGRKVCKYLSEEISFMDNRVVPCGTAFWVDRNDVHKFFLNDKGEDAEKEITRYIEQKNKYIDMYLDGKEPIFCKNCTQYKPIDNEQNIEEIKNNKFNKIIINNKLACSSRCIYCRLTDGGKLDKFEENENRITYDAIPLINEIEKKGLINENTEIEIGGGEYADYEKEFEEITECVKRNKCRFNIVTNGLKYSKKIEELLVKNKVRLMIPLDSGTKETYAKIKRMDKFDEVAENIKKYAQAALMNKENTFMQLKYTICPGINDNVEELIAFLKFCEQNNVFCVNLSMDKYWFDANMNNDVPDSLSKTIQYWFNNHEYESVIRNMDYSSIPNWWIDKILNS